MRISGVKAEIGHESHASIYTAIRQGLFVKPVSIGHRAVGWPDYEVKALISARIAGQTEADIRELVKRLHAKRIELVQASGG